MTYIDTIYNPVQTKMLKYFKSNKIKTFNIARPNDYNYLGAISDKIENVKISDLINTSN